MSKRVIIICLVLCLVGFVFGWGLFETVKAGSWRQQHGWALILWCSAGFFGLPAGIGMLLGYRVARSASVLAFVPGYLACAALLAAPLLTEGFIRFQINGHPAGYGACAALSLLLLGNLMLLHWTLYSPPFEEHLS